MTISSGRSFHAFNNSAIVVRLLSAVHHHLRMGWYHYECVDGSCDINKVVPCPDGTCPMPPAVAAAASIAVTPPDAAVDAVTTNQVTDHGEDTQQQEEVDEEEEEFYEAKTPIYHLCQKKLWEQALATQQPYYPPTFWKDGRLTRASCDSDTLPMTANHYYQGVTGDWLCLQLNPVKLRQLGIQIAVHREQQQQQQQSQRNRNAPVQCLKVFGGIPTMVDHVVTTVFALQRDGHGYFYGMVRDTSIPKNAIQTPPEQVPRQRLPTTSFREENGSTFISNRKSSSTSPVWRFWKKERKSASG